MNATARHSVLLVDDDRDFVALVEMLLAADERFVVVGTAPTGADAVQLAADLSPALVVMDIEMPVMNGIEATRLIRARDDACIVVLTGSDRSDLIQRALQAGAKAYVPKRRVADDLIARLESLVDTAEDDEGSLRCA